MNNYLKSNKSKLLILPLFFTLLLFIGTTYSLFTKKIDTTKMLSIKSGTNYIGVYGDNKYNIMAGTTYTFTLENRGSVNNGYYLYLDDKVAVSDLSTITYSYTKNGVTTSKKLSEVISNRQLDYGNLLVGEKITVTISLNDTSSSSYVGKLRVKTVNYINPTTPTITGGSTTYATSRTISVSTKSTTPTGIKNYQYYKSTSSSTLSGGSWTNLTTSATTQTFTGRTSFYVFFRAIDNNGITSSVSNSQAVYVGISYSIRNLVTNGSFENGSTSWSLSYANVVAGGYHGSYSLRLDPSVTAMSTQTLIYSAPTINHKYYGFLMLKTASNFTVADSRYEWYNTDATYALLVFTDKNYRTTSWVRRSSIQSVTSSAYLSKSWFLRNFTVNANTYAYVDSLVIVDLTATFGAGNEPDKTWCDSYINYFDGTVSIVYK